IVAAKRTARQFILHQIEVLAVAGAEFPFAFAGNIPGAADERSDLVTPAEADRVRDFLASDHLDVRRQEFILETNARVDSDVLEHLPGILDIKSMVAAAHLSVVSDTILPGVVTVGSLGIADAATREALAPTDLEEAVRVVVFHIVGEAIERVTAFEAMLLPKD